MQCCRKVRRTPGRCQCGESRVRFRLARCSASQRKVKLTFLPQSTQRTQKEKTRLDLRQIRHIPTWFLSRSSLRQRICRRQNKNGPPLRRAPRFTFLPAGTAFPAKPAGFLSWRLCGMGRGDCSAPRPRHRGIRQPDCASRSADRRCACRLPRRLRWSTRE